MLLPRDMNMIDDCLCDDGVDTTKEEQAAEAMDSEQFMCQGRYKPKHGVRTPESINDCDCYHPYEKDPSSQECVLTTCPRAGNYEPKADVTVVTSLADCMCTLPYLKIETSGQCVMSSDEDAATIAANVRREYKCPPNSTPTPDITPRSFDDCHCSWGFVRNAKEEYDCACLAGFEMAPLSEEEIARGDGDGFHCVASPEKNIQAEEAAATCRAPQVIHPLSGDCRLPVEEIPTKRTMQSNTLELGAKPEGVMFRGIEYAYDIVDGNIMVIQGDVAIGERSHDFVIIQGVESSCFSFIGRIGGPQRLGVSADCGLGNVVHVLLHAIGLRHAVDRADRDEHVRIAWECIPEAKRSYFVAEDMNSLPEPTTRRAANHVLDPPPYDFFSIMHHPADAFVHFVPSDKKPQWCPSVVPLVANAETRLAVMRDMGQRERMSTTDVESVWALYPGLKKKHQQQQKAGKNGEAQPEDLHEKYVHTDEDKVQVESAAGHASAHRSFGQRFISFLGAIAMLVGFGALLAFATNELRRRALLTSEDFFYEAPLIDSKNDI
ncbi:hypothetical protein PHYBOEH_006036 [Phytophthora boehmeriae]|uniref:Peptidase M12A domain-containing protein n=1 Tax=Phytophthora boehmeriae TaxID=109152 RepID=A0A8T1WMF0_9STRA|nr:hypothetical protein PHYBOEH_006036 [Phytophthora boehmeriae]